MNKKQILIVDDKEQIAKILYAYLQADYDCHYVQNPLHAIKRLLAGHMPDLIISDIRMPEMRGDEFLEYLKHNELFKQIPVVMLSSETAPRNASACWKRARRTTSSNRSTRRSSKYALKDSRLKYPVIYIKGKGSHTARFSEMVEGRMYVVGTSARRCAR